MCSGAVSVPDGKGRIEEQPEYPRSFIIRHSSLKGTTGVVEAYDPSRDEFQIRRGDGEGIVLASFENLTIGYDDKAAFSERFALNASIASRKQPLEPDAIRIDCLDHAMFEEQLVYYAGLWGEEWEGGSEDKPFCHFCLNKFESLISKCVEDSKDRTLSDDERTFGREFAYSLACMRVAAYKSLEDAVWITIAAEFATDLQTIDLRHPEDCEFVFEALLSVAEWSKKDAKRSICCGDYLCNPFCSLVASGMSWTTSF